MALGTVDGSTVQWGSELTVAQTPKTTGGVAAKPRAWSGLKPSWPVSTTVNTQPVEGVPPRDALGTLKVMYREIELALMLTGPSVLP